MTSDAPEKAGHDSAPGALPPTATVDLANGGKITSLIGAGAEWLLQPSGQPPVDDTFIGVGLSGWDECVPTIVACTGVTGTRFPDHGSVWSVPWQPAADGFATAETEHFVFGRRLTVSAGALLVEYALRSTAAVPTRVLWAAHPQIRAPAGTRVEIAPPDGAVVQVHPPPIRLRRWRSVDSIDSVKAGESRKLYLPQQGRVAQARIVRPDGRWLTFGWDSSLVPHLGIWFDAARFAHEPVIAVEPAIGWYDDLRVAAANGTALALEPAQTRMWWLRLTAGADTRAPGRA